MTEEVKPIVLKDEYELECRDTSKLQSISSVLRRAGHLRKAEDPWFAFEKCSCIKKLSDQAFMRELKHLVFETYENKKQDL